MRQVARSGLLCLLIAVAFVASSCRREPPSNVDRNRAPETYITRAPAESTLSYYRVHMYWSGSDPDGSIAYYELAVTDSNEIPGQDLEEGTGYTRTLKTDSVFVLRADPPIEQQILGHRLYVRAVDNEGKLDPTPALAYFVAQNDFYPVVDFRPGEGTWIERCSSTLTRVLNGVRDTIGVEGSARWSWGGHDNDVGGHVVGYQWKMASQTQYLGGGLGDTVAFVTFPPNASRRQTLQVRAIDDGGLRSESDYTQVVILNFDPITMVLHPTETNGDGTPRHALVFQQNDQVWPSGTTLPDVGNVQEVSIFYSGFDDPRDRQAACDEKGVHKYQTKILVRDDDYFGTPTGLSATFEDAVGTEPFPEKHTKQIFGLESGDNFILVRAVDDYRVVDSTPETVLVRINYRPYLTRLEARSASDTLATPIDLLAVRNSSRSNPIEIHLAPGDSAILVTMMGRDIHYPDPLAVPDPEAAAFDSNDVVAEELGSLNTENTYRVFVETANEPGYDFPPNHDLQNPYSKVIDVEPGIYKLIADVQDQSVTNVIGRRGRIVRYIKVVR